MTDAERITTLRAALIGAKRQHTEEGDPYYSCPKSESGADYWKGIPNSGSDCSCGADEHNAAIDAVLEATQ